MITILSIGEASVGVYVNGKLIGTAESQEEIFNLLVAAEVIQYGEDRSLKEFPETFNERFV